MANQPMVIGGVIALILGIIMIIVGIVLWEVNLKNKKAQPFYVYILLVGGLIIGIIGGAVLGIGLATGKKQKLPQGQQMTVDNL